MGFSGLFNIPKNTPTALIPGTATARSSHLSQSNCIIAYRIIGTLVSEKTPLRTQPPKSCLRKMTSWSWTKHKPCIKCCGAIIDDVLHWEVTSCGPSLIMLVPGIIKANMHIKFECFLIELCVNAKKKFVQVICYSMTRIYIQLPKRLSHTYSIPFLLLVYSALHVYYPQFLNSFLFSVFSFPFFFK